LHLEDDGNLVLAAIFWFHESRPQSKRFNLALQAKQAAPGEDKKLTLRL
jgi:hypothetical protein